MDKCPICGRELEFKETIDREIDDGTTQSKYARGHRNLAFVDPDKIEQVDVFTCPVHSFVELTDEEISEDVDA